MGDATSLRSNENRGPAGVPGDCAARALAPVPEKSAPVMHILLMEDDPQSAENTARLLREHNHVVDVAHDGELGLELARTGTYQALIVDRRMPLRDGLSVVRALRQRDIRTPAIFLTAIAEVDDRVEGLKVGGDDYLAKPYAISELLARLDAVVRRANPKAVQTHLCVGDLELDLLSRKVQRGGQEIVLQPREFSLLEFLMKHAEQVVTRGMLLEQVWGIHFDPQTNVIDVHISRLRAKIDRSFDKPMLHTVRGAGYSLRAAH
jgi:two-component system OmpR family response regulator